jgi:hypothetical protein
LKKIVSRLRKGEGVEEVEDNADEEEKKLR